MFVISGKVALITGGASGIGLCYAKELLRNSLKAVALADVNEEYGANAVQEITREFGENRVIFVKTDVTDKVQFEDAFKATIKAFKNLDILINNAGILNDVIWEKQILINVNGTIHGTYLAIENYLQKYRTGSETVVVNVSSIAGLQPFGCIPVYTATKHAIIGLSRSFGTKLHYDRTKVKVLTVCPGITDTPLIEVDEHNVKTFGPKYTDMVPKETSHLLPQPPQYVAKAVITIIEEGDSGSVWIAENKEPPYEIYLPERQYYRKQ